MCQEAKECMQYSRVTYCLLGTHLMIFRDVLRAIPFEKLVGGVSGVSFSDHPAAIFHYFLGYPAMIFFPLTQCKKRPVRPPRSDFEKFSDHPAAFF